MPLDAAALYRGHARFVAGFLSRLGSAQEDVADLTQEVFLVAHRRGGWRPGPARPTTWLAEIAVRVASQSRRTVRRRHEVADDGLDRQTSSTATPAEAAETTEAMERVSRALGTLDVAHRAVFVLFEIEGESCDGIAAGLGIPVGTVYSRLHAARRKFTAAHERLVAVPAALREVG